VSMPPTTTFSVSCLAWVDLPTPTKRFKKIYTNTKVWTKSPVSYFNSGLVSLNN
jgi:hypothetical protein